MYTFTWLSLVPLIFIIGVAQAENVFIQPPNKDLEQETSEIFSLGDRMNITLITDLDLVQILVQTDNTPDYHDSLHIYTEPRPREGRVYLFTISQTYSVAFRSFELMEFRRT